jgi:hypothetical protein
MPKESIKSRLDRFIENDFHHVALEVANLKGQVKIILMVLGIIAVATVGEFVAIVIQGVLR